MSAKVECKYIRIRNKIYDFSPSGLHRLREEHDSISQAKKWSRLEQLRHGGRGMGLVRVERVET